MWVAWKFPEMANTIRKFLERYSPRNQKLSKDETPEKEAHLWNQVQLLVTEDSRET
jgi:hypothetical protein